jgi:hypothetical protein
MGYFYQDWKDKKLFVEDSEGQFVMNFGEAEKSMIESLESAVINLTEGASDEKRMAVNYIEYLAECLKKGKLEVKWNIS